MHWRVVLWGGVMIGLWTVATVRATEDTGVVKGIAVSTAKSQNIIVRAIPIQASDGSTVGIHMEVINPSQDKSLVLIVRNDVSRMFFFRLLNEQGLGVSPVPQIAPQINRGPNSPKEFRYDVVHPCTSLSWFLPIPARVVTGKRTFRRAEEKTIPIPAGRYTLTMHFSLGYFQQPLTVKDFPAEPDFKSFSEKLQNMAIEVNPKELNTDLVAAYTTEALGAAADKVPKSSGVSEEDWQRLIESERSADRRRGRRLVLAERKKTIEKLLTMVRAPIKKRERFFDMSTNRNIAIFLLGKFRAEEAVSDLAPWLMPKEGQSAYMDEQRDMAPAGYALVEIGLPSVEPVLAVLRREGCTRIEWDKVGKEKWPGRGAIVNMLGDQALLIIGRILGREATQFVLEELLKKDLPEQEKDNLRSALEWLKRPTRYPLTHGKKWLSVLDEKIIVPVKDIVVSTAYVPCGDIMTSGQANCQGLSITRERWVW